LKTCSFKRRGTITLLSPIIFPGGSEKSSERNPSGRKDPCERTESEVDMQAISTRQRFLLRAIMVAAILLFLAMLGLLSRGPAIVH
jgi:hypothetical protein